MKHKLPATILYAIILLILAIIAPIILSDIDYYTDWFIFAALFAFFMLFILALIDVKKLILFLIFIAPALFYFNYIKINVAPYLPFLRNNSLILNPIAVIYLFLILLGLISIIEKWQEIKKMPLKFIILISIIYGALSLFWTVDKNTSLIELIYLIVPFALYAIAHSYFKTKSDLMKIIFAAIISSIIPAVAAVWQLATHTYFYEPDSTLGRICGTFTHPNSFGLYLFLILGLMIACAAARTDKSFKNGKLLFFYGLFLLILLVLTYSRTAWLCCAAFVVILFFIKRRFIPHLLFLSSLAAAALLAVNNIKERIMEPFSSAIFNSWMARINIWKVALAKIAQKPLAGYGIGASESVIEASKTWDGGTSLPHNDFILHALELGAGGVLTFSLYTFGAIFCAFKTFLILPDKSEKIILGGRAIEINFKTLSCGIFAILSAMLIASVFESASQKIILQIIIWPILGSLLNYMDITLQNRT